MSTLLSRTFARAALERAIKTGAQAATASFAVGGGLLDVDWQACLSVTGAAIILSLLTSVISAAATDGSPSLSTAEVLSEPGQTGESTDAGPVEVTEQPAEYPDGTPARTGDDGLLIIDSDA